MQSRKPIVKDNFVDTLKYNNWKVTLSLPDVIYLAYENQSIMVEYGLNFHYHRVDTSIHHNHKILVDIEVSWCEFDRFLELIQKDGVVILPLELL